MFTRVIKRTRAYNEDPSSANNNGYQLNFVQLIGHGCLHQGDSFLVVPPGKKDESAPRETQLINISNYARKLSVFKRTISVILFDAGREQFEQDS